MPCQLFADMLKLSRNNQNIEIIRGPPEHSAIGNIHKDILLVLLHSAIQNNCRWV